MEIYNDTRTVMTLDAGGTNLVFSAIRGGEEIVPAIVLPSNSSDLDRCLETIIKGFREIKEQLAEEPVAISFAFPGPADYRNGVIGDLPNFPSFRGGVALGPMLEHIFQVPVIINNDGDLFTYGEAVAGFLPEINNSLREGNSGRCFKNLIGITLGTGFGGGVVLNGNMCNGDNSAAGEVWLLRNFTDSRTIAEEGISIRGLQRSFREVSGEEDSYTPKEIYEMAAGLRKGNQAAAVAAFQAMAREVGEALANTITLIDGAVVIGGGLSGASEFLLPGIVAHLNGAIEDLYGNELPRVVSKAYNLNDSASYNEFMQLKTTRVKVPFMDKEVEYNREKAIPIGISRLGTSKAVSLGAYAVALTYLNQMAENQE